MAYVTETRIGRRSDADDLAAPSYFTTILTAIVVINLFTILYHALNSAIFNTISNAACICLIGYAAYSIIRSQTNTTANIVYILAACTFVFLSILFNFGKASVTEGIKFLSIYIFYAAGYARASAVRPTEIRYIYLLAALPILFLVTLGSSRVPEFTQLNIGNTFSYFANANQATLYFSALIFTMATMLGTRAILLQFVNVALMNKVGVAVATVVAICLWIAIPLRRESIIGLIIFTVVAVVAYAAGAFDRILANLASMSLLIDMGPDYVSRMSFRRLVELTGTTDLSGFFRIIHWANIWDIYSSSTLLTKLFGYGIGQSQYLTVLQFVPHNDYLRILAEYGFLNLVVFVSFLLHVLFNLKTGHTKVLFMVLLIYFFSENLIDHFSSMTLYFTYAGRFAALPAKEAPKLLRRPR